MDGDWNLRSWVNLHCLWSQVFPCSVQLEQKKFVRDGFCKFCGSYEMSKAYNLWNIGLTRCSKHVLLQGIVKIKLTKSKSANNQDSAQKKKWDFWKLATLLTNVISLSRLWCRAFLMHTPKITLVLQVRKHDKVACQILYRSFSPLTVNTRFTLDHHDCLRYDGE